MGKKQKPEPLTEEQKKEKRKAQLQALHTAIENLTYEAGFKRWLKVRTTASLSRFSLSNQFMIAWQKPDATALRTFQGWKSLNRKVRKGEKAILILKPIIKTIKEVNPLTGEEYEIERCVGWSGLKEFDISQTEGEPVDFEEKVIGTEKLAECWDKLVAYGVKLGYTIERVEKIAGGAHGDCNPKTKHIRVVNGKRAIDDQVRTLIHELAHAHDIDYVKFTREDAEIIVEQTTAIILIELGIEDISASAQYIASWSDGEVAKVRARVTESNKVAEKLEAALGIGG